MTRLVPRRSSKHVTGRTARRAVAALTGCAVIGTAGVLLGTSGTAWSESMVTLPGSAPSAAATAVGAVPASQQLTVQVWLTPDLGGAAAFADAVATPGNAEFHHFLSPDAYTARFGPSSAHAAAIARWLTAGGLTKVHASSGRDYVSATGPVSAVQSALRVRIDNYRVPRAHGTPTVIQSNDREVSVPAPLAPDVLGVTGLNTAPPPTFAKARRAAKASDCSQYWAQHVQTFQPSFDGLSKGTRPVCGYSADQIRAAYGANRTDTGRGQTVALTEESAPDAMVQTLKDYAKSNHLPAPKPGQFRQQQADGGGTCGNSARASAKSEASQFDPPVDDESEMDSEAVYTMAPGASQLMVIGSGCNEDQALLNAATSVLTGDGHHPSASIVSNSWGFDDGNVQPVHAMDLRAAGEGVGMYFSSGDTPGVSTTNDDPYATMVGGTTLGIGPTNNRVLETGWSNKSAYLSDGKWTGQSISLGSGGGTSTVYGQPAYQKGVVPASMSHTQIGKQTAVNRATPDIAADGDLDTGMLTGYIQLQGNGKPGPYQTLVNAGTSLACPLVAGLVADAQQDRKLPFGFINPVLYRLSGTAALHDTMPVTEATPPQNRAAYIPASGTDSAEVDVFDAQDPANTHQVTARGYDTMTGLGTPNGTAFLNGLRRAAG